ncbi:hypothetical protein N8H22_15680 [Stutzerimonas stutzeri]|uniref:hypothetical protein n=1 Tax=Stutzerimonas sp. S1 TaxID=3030652 RepID=UPI00222594C3|nr:hypothetical protein [Stutzerimonas sp. S1]MCW3150046.1 hypothetical protein [Stutzerimonas sp. S1]
MINNNNKSITITGKIPVSGISENLEIHLIQITEDKLRNILIENQQALERRNEWVAPFGISLTLLITIITTTPTDSFGLNSSGWQALFYFCLIAAVIKTITTFVNRPKKTTIENIVDRIKNVRSGR